MSEDSVEELIDRNRHILSSPVRRDSYLSQVGRNSRSHRLLANCTQGVYQRQVKFLSNLLVQTQGKPPHAIKILDWGCGRGHITYLLKKHGFNVTACDRDTRTDTNSAFQIDRPILSEQRIDVVPLQNDVELPFRSSEFDCVVSFGVLEHVANDLGSLKEIRRILKPHGLLYIVFLPYSLSWTQALARLAGDRYHDRLYWRRDVSGLAAATGFRVRSVWFGQLLPKNPVPFAFDQFLEPIDRAVCRFTPLRYFSTNLEVVMTPN